MIELTEILDFFLAHPPFDQLQREQLRECLRGLQAEYFPKGGQILEIGQENHLLHIVRSGAVELHDSDNSLVARMSEGESFGYISSAQRKTGTLPRRGGRRRVDLPPASRFVRAIEAGGAFTGSLFYRGVCRKTEHGDPGQGTGVSLPQHGLATWPGVNWCKWTVPPRSRTWPQS